MANTRQGNTWYIDTGSSALTTDINQRVVGLWVCVTANSAQLILKETSGGAVKFDFRHHTGEEVHYYDWSNSPIQFNNGIYVGTLTNCNATLILSSKGGP